MCIRDSGEGVRVMALDTFVAIMAGLIIFPACMAFGVAADSGPEMCIRDRYAGKPIFL